MTNDYRAKTIFISSKMELVDERRAAFSAIMAEDFIPLQYEIEPSRPIKEMLDSLVDRADIFVGIYAGSVGERSHVLGSLTPIEYEFWRFVTKLRLFPARDSNRIGDTIEREITNNMQDSNWIETLRELLCRSYRTKEERAQDVHGDAQKKSLTDLIYERMRFLVRCGRVGHGEESRPLPPTAMVLPPFLRGIPDQCLISYDEYISHEVAPKEKTKIFLPASIELYRKLRNILNYCATFPSEAACGNAESTGQVRNTGIANNKIIRAQLAMEDKPGRLRDLLLVCYSHGLNLVALKIDKPTNTPSSIAGELRLSGGSTPPASLATVRIVVEPFFTLVSQNNAEDLREVLKVRLERIAAGNYAEVNLEDKDKLGATGSATIDEYRGPFIQIESEDVPGVLLSIASVAAVHGFNIDQISYARRPNHRRVPDRIVDFRISISGGGMTDTFTTQRKEADNLECLVHHMRSVYGIRSITSNEGFDSLGVETGQSHA